MPYITTALNHTSNYTLQATTTTGSAACTITTIKSTGSMSSELLTSPNGARSIPTGAARMIFTMNAPAGTTGVFKVIQSGVTLADLTVGGTSPLDLTVTFEVT
jgi:hypothetical protein